MADNCEFYIVAGVCYGEFGVRVPKTTGSAYMYSYVTVGEFVAFLIGWNLILEYMIGSAAGASALSACFDALANHTMSTALEEHVGTVIGKTYPDFLGCAIGLAMTAVLAVGVKKSVRFNNVLNIINFLVWVFIVIAGFFYMDTSNWADGFAPYGASGVFSGAATCFYAFIGFDIIATTGEEAKNPSRSIPMAIIVSLVVCLTAYISSTMVLTLMVPYDDIQGDSALIDMFVQNGLPGAKFVVALGAVCALTVSLLGSMWPMPRVIYAMSRDGLLFQFLSVLHPYTNTPLVTTIITGVLASLMALLVGLQILVEMMSIGTLLAYTLVCTSVFILRYQPTPHQVDIPMAHKLDPIEEGSDDVMSPSESESGGILGVPTHKPKLKDNENLIGGEGQKSYGSLPFVGGQVETGMNFINRHCKIWWLRLGFPSDECVPTHATAQTVIIFVGVLGVIELATCLLIVFGSEYLAAGTWWAVIILLIFISGICASLVVILRQPQNPRRVDFMAPAVPFLPALAIFINIYLMLKLPGLTWARLGVWILLGLVLYFSYSMWHSVKEKSKNVPQPTESKPPMDITPSVKPLPPQGPANSVIKSTGYGYDQDFSGGDYSYGDFSLNASNLTGPLPQKGGGREGYGNGDVHQTTTDASGLGPWPESTSNTNASDPWTPQSGPNKDQTMRQRQFKSNTSAKDERPKKQQHHSERQHPPIIRRQSSERPPRPRQPPRRQSTEERPERPPPPRRQSTESSTGSSPWTSQDRNDPWQPPSQQQRQKPGYQQSAWQPHEDTSWESQQPDREPRDPSPDPWARGPKIAPTNPFWSAMQEEIDPEDQQ